MLMKPSKDWHIKQNTNVFICNRSIINLFRDLHICFLNPTHYQGSWEAKFILLVVNCRTKIQNKKRGINGRGVSSRYWKAFRVECDFQLMWVHVTSRNSVSLPSPPESLSYQQQNLTASSPLSKQMQITYLPSLQPLLLLFLRWSAIQFSVLGFIFSHLPETILGSS